MNIIELAKDADIYVAHLNKPMTDKEVRLAFLERFAELVRAEALEEAAKVCDEGTGNAVQTDVLKVLRQERERIAEAIRGLK